ncbi:anthranilate phosphoribosyltransferase [candidate division WOR-1 bacterium RIFOXYB2_FULL_42_35]|uniref:Anthranilate phosphoribosyltransferase n=1 Tax=candidate division WOR-1 bacterium RIFOXYC2_FULL_41_25 TaxID=1802586 RepID=A0A1F4TP44_UNCSA|nr:MAG: anthranilate phosphoribosyltransferase [candidate division WOR-1 bacterium RIFOXYA2_FULL_41_14]OGC25082.1 MAG: anthranilate phosphoribosyltransferase [candidate division WOR-1 bacterium RIFOXYB2_FULL_42_35]OGC34482.1 MAG: anthranilate phosphoribosyltransferase [candidate division WOR-1 bacterium RIFOXYC2_FULL_41_25]OGC43878.1 MAG: anthranilate phosphoribosyltransferase [candidate division WOR-1 bacterium RIFOXYD2_FULL_41_8]
MIKDAIKKIVERQDLTRQEAAETMDTIMKGEATPSQIAAFITALRMKGEAVDEITGCAEKMRQHAININPQSKNLVDTCGTGGDVSGTFNISTITALVAAGAGISIAKHGNRSVSSRCGSADLLEALGVKIDLEPNKVEQCINEVGMGFIFAPIFHQAMKFAMPTRKEIGIRTVFNILGPLTNPARANAQVLGVFHPNLTEMLAAVLGNLGVKQALVVHGMDGLDEISICDKTLVSQLKDGKVENYLIKPEDLGIKRAKREEILGGSVEENVEITYKILTGKEKGPKRDIVLVNAAAAIYVGGKSKDLKAGIKIASDSIESGAANKKLEELIACTSKLKN